MNKKESKIKIECYNCGKIKEKFPSQIHKYNFCSKDCYFKSDLIKNRPEEHRKNISKSKIGIKLSKEHKEKIKQSCIETFKSKSIRKKRSERMKGEKNPNYKGNYWKYNTPLYDTYANQINFADEVRKSPMDKNILEVKCTYCGKWHIPKSTNVHNRIKSLNGNINGEHHFYCSDECKQECSIYGKINYQVGHPKSEENNRPYQQEWSKMICERENYICEICGEYGNIGHHILPVKTYPHLQADIDNGICLCDDCHKEHGHKDECSTGNLANLVC